MQGNVNARRANVSISSTFDMDNSKYSERKGIIKGNVITANGKTIVKTQIKLFIII